MSNDLQKQGAQPPAAPQNSQALQNNVNGLLSRLDVKKRFEEILGQKAQGFISSVLNVVKNNKMLATAEPNSVLGAAVIAATLDLPIDPNLGFAAIVPYNDYKNNRTLATFQMMYKGYIQLAQRSGQYKTINVTEVYEGELIENNRLTGEFVIDEGCRKSNKIIGYAAYFKLINGFEKPIYWDIPKIEAHGHRFSKSYKTGLWNDRTGGGFEAMASKTVLKHLISKYGILSIDYQMSQALKYDQAAVTDYTNDEPTPIYIDNVPMQLAEGNAEKVNKDFAEPIEVKPEPQAQQPEAATTVSTAKPSAKKAPEAKTTVTEIPADKANLFGQDKPQ